MTAAIHHFPAPVAFTEALRDKARRDAIVTAARTILRSACDHSDDVLHEACVSLQTWGDGADFLEAGAMLLAMRLRQRRRAHEAAQVAAAKGQPGLIRGELARFTAFALFAAVTLILIPLF